MNPQSLIPNVELETAVINILENCHRDFLDELGELQQSGIVIDLLTFGTTDPAWYSGVSIGGDGSIGSIEELIEAEA